MAKEIDKFKKDSAPLLKIADKLVTDYLRHGTNRQHHKDMLLESAKEIGREVQISKDKGVAGADLKAFMKEPGVLGVMKTVLDAFSALSKEEAGLKTMTKDATGTLAKSDKLIADMKKEIDKRNDKKNRKLFAKDSKSLPEMEKLHKSLCAARQRLFDEVTTDIQAVKWNVTGERKNFDKWVSAEIGRTKDDRNKIDQKEADTQGMDMRNVVKSVGQVKKLVAAGNNSLKDAIKNVKTGLKGEAEVSLKKAKAALAAIEKTHAPYKREIDSKNKYSILAMKDSKDGKFILSSVDNMADVKEKLEDAIKKVSAAVG